MPGRRRGLVAGQASSLAPPATDHAQPAPPQAAEAAAVPLRAVNTAPKPMPTAPQPVADAPGDHAASPPALRAIALPAEPALAPDAAPVFAEDPTALAPGEISPTSLSRRGTSAARFDPFARNYLVPESWSMVAVAMATAALMTALGRWAMPVPQVLGVIALAMALALAAPMFIRFERGAHRGMPARYTAMVLAIVLPMGLYGSAMAWWVKLDPALTITSVASAMLVLAMVATIALSSRLPSLVAGNCALWGGFALVIRHHDVWIALALCVIAAIGATVRQVRLDRETLAEQSALRRDQLRAEEILADFEQTGQGWFWETDRRGMVTYLSASIETVLGRPTGSMAGRPLTDLFHAEAGEGASERTIAFHLNTRSSFQDLAMRADCPGDERYWSVNGRPIYDSFGNFLGFRGSGSDLTEQRRSQQHASRLALFDSLTGLANRHQMAQTLEKILQSPNPNHRACAVFLLDLDRFKQVNDTLGHPAGDALLKQVAQRLQNTVGDLGRVGRLGGDEFKCVLPGTLTRERLAMVADVIIENLSQPYRIDGNRVVIGASVGIAIAPEDGVTSEEIIRSADLALYAAKDRGRGVHHFYDANLHESAEERRHLEQDLRDALIHGGLELYYQPVVQVASQRISGFEALLRWNHPVKGQLSPAKFIPVAEETGLIVAIGEWALRTACHDLAQWPEEVRVAVNVSPIQFSNPALPAIVTSALANAGIAPERLELELTESVFLNNDEGTDAMFAALKGIGVRLALDDFGTGYSSLGYLKNAPFDKIKIDQSFVRGATLGNSRNGAIIASIVSLAEALGMETTAEGVEMLDELELMRELGVSHIQGYIYAKPLCREDATGKLGGDLSIEAKGPRSARAARRTMLRRVVLEHDGARYDVTIRNLSDTGAMLEGLWNVPNGLEMDLNLAETLVMPAAVRWSQEGRVGVEFARRLSPEEYGQITALRGIGVVAAGRRGDAVRKVV